MVRIFHPEGKIESREGNITLKEAQAAVHGYVEMLKTPNGTLLMDEDARCKGGVAINVTASEVMGFELLGPVVLLDGKSKLKG